MPHRDSLCALPGHFQPQYLGASSSSEAALAYIQWLQQVVSDGNQSPDYATVRASHAHTLRAHQTCIPHQYRLSAALSAAARRCVPRVV